jgi:hypothetical protein
MPSEWGDKWTYDGSALKCGMKYGLIFITYVLIALGRIFIWDNKIHHLLVYSALTWPFSVGLSME